MAKVVVRRTNAEIAQDKKKEEERKKRRRATFFLPAQRPTPTTNQQLPPPPPPPPPPQQQQQQQQQQFTTTRIMDDNHDRSPTDDDPLPGVVMDRVPPFFQRKVGDIMHSLRSQMKGRTAGSNQYTRRTTGSREFPWKSAYFNWPDPIYITGAPTAADFLAPKFARLLFFAPDKTAPHLLPTGTMPCKWHGFKANTSNSFSCVRKDLFFNNFVQSFHCEDGGAGFCFTSRYCCTIREKIAKDEGTSDDDLEGDGDDNHFFYFTGHDKDVLKRLDPNVRRLYPLVATKGQALTQQLSDEVYESAATKQGFSGIHRKLISHRKNSFVSILREINATGRNYSLDPSANVTQQRLSSMDQADRIGALRLQLDDVVLTFPSSQYLQNNFIIRALEKLPYYELALQMISGRVLCADKSYKVVKFVYVNNGGQVSKAFDSVYTVMNEYNQIVSINFTEAGGFDEMENILQGIQKRYKVRGYQEVRLFYTDSCCQEYPMLLRALPSLGKDDESTCRDNLEKVLEPASLPFAPTFITTRDVFTLELTSICEVLDAAGDTPVEIGLDIEWNSMSKDELSKQIPETLQLAVDWKSTAPPEQYIRKALVVSLRQVYPELFVEEATQPSKEHFLKDHGLLRRLVTHTNCNLVGVNIKGDLTRLRKNFTSAFIGDEASCTISDCAAMAEKGRLLFSTERPSKSLQNLCAELLLKKLDKSRARSRWSKTQLSLAEINYAALDAWIGIEIYRAIKLKLQSHFVPSKQHLKELVDKANSSPEIPPVLVRMYPSRTNLVCAIGQVQSYQTRRQEVVDNRVRLYDEVTIKILHVIDGAVRVVAPGLSSATIAEGNSESIADAFGKNGSVVVWNRNRLSLSNVQDSTDYKDTLETFYTPTVNKAMELSATGGVEGGQVFSHQVVKRATESVRSGAEFLSRRMQDEVGIPITKFTKDDEKVFDEILTEAALPYNFAAMAAAHGERAECEALKSVDQRKQIFAKTAQMYKERHALLVKWKNKNRTQLHQLAMVEDSNGLSHMTTVRRGATTLQEQIQQASQRLEFTDPEPFSPPDQPNLSSKNNDRLFLGPPSLPGTSVMLPITEELPGYLQMPRPTGRRPVEPHYTVEQGSPPPKRSRQAQRCYRCGWERIGAHHSRAATVNTAQYCTIPSNSRFPNWQTPLGYNEGDPLPLKLLSSKTMISRWRQYRKEKGIAAHHTFPNW